MKQTVRVLLCSALITGMLTSQVAWAGYVPSEEALVTEQTEQTRAEILSVIERADVREALEDRGVSPDEAEKRIAMLSPSQVEQLKTQLDTLPAGEGAVGAIVGALLIVFFVLLFTDLLGETDAYDFDD